MRYIFAVMLCSGLCGQETGSLRGTVLDASGSSIPHASVNLTLSGESQPVTTRSDDRGSFRFKGLSAGSYDLAASAPGFLKSIHRAIDVHPGENAQLPAITLQIGYAPCTADVYGPGIGERPTSGKPGISGSLVSGPQGLGGATVFVTDLEGRHQRKAKTDSQGRFEFRDVRPGSYLLTAKKPGYATFLIDLKPLRVSLGHDAVIEPLPMYQCSTGATCNPVRSIAGITICE